MKIKIVRKFALFAVLLGATSAFALDKASIWNAAHYPAAVTVRYAGCVSDTFTVPAATSQSPGRATAGSNRGGCLITTISATLQGKPYKIADYSSSGAPFSRFVIRYMGGENYKIYSDGELQNIFDREATNPSSPEGEFKTPAQVNPLNAPKGSPTQLTIAACREANVKLDQEIDALFTKAYKERKITSAEEKRYYQLERAIKERRTKLASDGFTLADCNSMTLEYEKEKAEVIKMAQ